MNIELKERLQNAFRNTLPLQKVGAIRCANSLKIDWNEVCPHTKDEEVFIFGNPPYLGTEKQSLEQKKDLEIKDAMISFSDNDVYKELKNIFENREKEKEKILQLINEQKYHYKIQYPKDIVKFENPDIQNIFEENGFSYDKKNVYYAGRKLNDISSAGFKVTRLVNRPNLPVNFLNDNKNIYKLIAVFDEETGELKSVKTAVVKNPKVDSKTFETFSYSGNYFRDKNNVYYENELYKIDLKKIAGADRNSFEVLNDEFSRDKNNVYYYGNKMKGINPDGFEFVGRDFKNNEDIIFFLKTKDKVYVLKNKAGKEVYEIVPLNFDANSFKYSNADNSYESESVGYFQDKNGVYYFDAFRLDELNPNKVFAKVEGADTSSFVQLMFGYAKDKNKVYIEDREIKGADPESFKIIETSDGVTIRDKNKIYKEFKK